MKTKCLILNFRNAGLFEPNGFKDKHRMIEDEQVVDRKGTTRFIKVPHDTLLKEHVANVLLVLAGERPVPTIRKHNGDLKADVSITDLADGAMVEMAMGFYTDKDGNLRLIKEYTSTTKAIGNSKKVSNFFMNLKGTQSASTVFLSWEVIKNHLGLSLFAKFKDMTLSVLGVEALDFNMIKVFEKLYESKDQKVKDFCALDGVGTPYYRMLVEGNAVQQDFHFTGYGSLKHWFYNLLTHGSEQVSRLGGKIYVPVTEEYIDRLKNGEGFATLLDGGLVTISDIQDNSELLYLNAKPVFKRS